MPASNANVSPRPGESFPRSDFICPDGDGRARPAGSSRGGVEVWGRRHLPFLMVRVEALQAIRNETTGLIRAAALGAYVRMCAAANEQRAVGEHKRFYAYLPQLAEILGGVKRERARALRQSLVAAGVLHWSRRFDDDGLEIAGEHILLHQDRGFVAVTTVVLVAIDRHVGARVRLAALGLYATLLELAEGEPQQSERLRVTVSRRRLAVLVGVSVDSLDRRIAELADAGVLRVRHRREGRLNQPNVIELLTDEEVAGYPQARTDPGRRTGSVLAADGSQGWPQDGSDPGSTWVGKGGRSEDTPQAPAACAYVRTGNEPEAPTLEKESISQRAAARDGGEGVHRDDQISGLCEELAARAQERVGPLVCEKPDWWDRQPDRWRQACTKLIRHYGVDGVRQMIATLDSDDWFLAEIVTMPALLAKAIRVQARLAARRHRSSPGSRSSEGLPAWPEAKVVLLDVARRHGRNGATAARHELADGHPRLAAVLELVRWTRLHDAPESRWDFDIKPLYEQACSQMHTTREDGAP